MCTYPFAKKPLTLYLARGEGRECYFGCNLMQRKVLASSHQHLMAEALHDGSLPQTCHDGVRRVLTPILRSRADELPLSIIIIGPGLDSRARTALEHMLESVVSARGKVLRTNFSATSRVTRATKLTQAASRHSYRWCSPPTPGSATTFAVGDGRCVTALKLGVSLFSPKWQRSS